MSGLGFNAMNDEYRYRRFSEGWQAVVKERGLDSDYAMSKAFKSWEKLGGRNGEEELAGRRLGVAWALFKANQPTPESNPQS